MSSEISASVGGFGLPFPFLGCLYFFYFPEISCLFPYHVTSKKTIKHLMVQSVKEDGEESKLTAQVKASQIGTF